MTPSKKQKWPKIIFFGTIINKNPVSGRAMVKGKMLHFVAFFVHFDKLIRPHPGPLWGVPPKSVTFFLVKILSVKGGVYPLTDKIRKVVFDHLPKVQFIFFNTRRPLSLLSDFDPEMRPLADS